MANNKLDGKFVEYDLDTAINVLDIANGGTGRADFAVGDNGHLLIYNGNVAEIQPINISGDLVRQAVTGYNTANGNIESRLVAAKNHIDSASIHIPFGGTNSTFLRGDRTWQSISSSADAVIVTNNFDNISATNVQAALEALDDEVTSLNSDISTLNGLTSNGVGVTGGGYDESTWSFVYSDNSGAYKTWNKTINVTNPNGALIKLSIFQNGWEEDTGESPSANAINVRIRVWRNGILLHDATKSNNVKTISWNTMFFDTLSTGTVTYVFRADLLENPYNGNDIYMLNGAGTIEWMY